MENLGTGNPGQTKLVTLNLQGGDRNPILFDSTPTLALYNAGTQTVASTGSVLLSTRVLQQGVPAHDHLPYGSGRLRGCNRVGDRGQRGNQLCGRRGVSLHCWRRASQRAHRWIDDLDCGFGRCAHGQLRSANHLQQFCGIPVQQDAQRKYGIRLRLRQRHCLLMGACDGSTGRRKHPIHELAVHVFNVPKQSSWPCAGRCLPWQCLSRRHKCGSRPSTYCRSRATTPIRRFKPTWRR